MTTKIEAEISSLETRADELRSRFLSTVDALETRARGRLDAAERVLRKGLPLAVLAGGLLLSVVGALALWYAARLARRRTLRRRTLDGLLPWRFLPSRRIRVARSKADAMRAW